VFASRATITRIMRLSRRTFLSLAALSPVACAQAETRVQSPDNSPLGPGRHKLGLSRGRDGVIVVPASFQSSKPAPLIVMLHGAGGAGENVANRLGLADEFGLVVLAPDSRDERTWDMIIGGGFGPDVEFINDAVASVKRRCTIDSQHVTLAGFSDGASYALSLGIGAGDVFSKVIAFSPGILQPPRTQGKPRIFISHGTEDNILPIDVTSHVFVPRLKQLGYDVTYEEFQGRHTIPPEILRKALTWNAQN
jgi:phospholipase/carboxylesterase